MLHIRKNPGASDASLKKALYIGLGKFHVVEVFPFIGRLSVHPGRDLVLSINLMIARQRQPLLFVIVHHPASGIRHLPTCN